MLETTTAPAIASSAPTATEHTLPLRDGTQLFYRAWLPALSANKALILFHRGHEHSGRWQETVEKLALPDVAVFAWDARGHGRSPGDRGSAPDLATVVRDAEEWVRHIAIEHGIAVENMVVLAHSVGAVVASAWVHDYAPPIRGLILATPALRVKLYVPFAVPFLRLKQRLFGPGYVKSYVKAGMLTHDPVEAERYRADPLIFPQIAVCMLLDLYDTSTRLLADAGAITVPTLMLVAGSDWVVKQSAQRQFLERLSSPVKQLEVLPGFSHAIFHEKDRHLVVAKVRAFVQERFAADSGRELLNRTPGAPLLAPLSPVLGGEGLGVRGSAAPPSLLDADRFGYTKSEYDRLCAPGGLRFWPIQLMMKTGGRLSKGIALGWELGFDSGTTLDYIYENRPQGTTLLGRLIDRGYLNSIGWRGIRVRRANLERVLRETIERTHAAGKPVRLLDIACGGGRYVLETLSRLKHIQMTAVLRDYMQVNLDAARKLTDALGLANVTLVQGDAFDRGSLAAIAPRPTIAIVSGLYELYPENEPLRRSLGGLADAIEPGGYLIYTNQPWHPQVEFIARVLTNREGKPWIMRRRTQAEMDALVRTAGFEKIAQEIDAWGIFTVSAARRAGA